MDLNQENIVSGSNSNGSKWLYHLVKITIPPRDFSAERRINGEVLLKWKNDPRLILMFHILKDSLLYRLGKDSKFASGYKI